MHDIYDFHYLRLGQTLLEKVGQFDRANAENLANSESLRAEMLREFLEERLNRRPSPEAITAINATTRNPGQCDEIELGRVLRLLVGNR